MTEKEKEVEVPEQAPAETPEGNPEETQEDSQQDVDSEEIELAKAMIAEAEAKAAKAESKQKQAEFTIEKLKKQFKAEDPAAVDDFELSQKIEDRVNEAVAEATAKLTDKLAEETSAKVSRLKSQLEETKKAAMKKKDEVPSSPGQKPENKEHLEAPDPRLARFMSNSGFVWDSDKGDFVKK